MRERDQCFTFFSESFTQLETKLLAKLHQIPRRGRVSASHQRFILSWGKAWEPRGLTRFQTLHHSLRQGSKGVFKLIV